MTQVIHGLTRDELVKRVYEDPQRNYRCDRCQESKPADRFRENQPYWNKWCIRCEASPTGDFPIPETDEHRRKPDGNQKQWGGE